MGLTEFQLIDAMKTRHTAVLGMTRTGKTYFVGKALKRLRDNENVHTIFVDPKQQVTMGLSKKEICTTPTQVLECMMRKQKNIVFYPRVESKYIGNDLNRVVDHVFAVNKKEGFRRIRRVVAIDEVQSFVRKGISDGLDKLYLIGAGVGITGVCMTQRLQNMNETVWSQSENKVIFRIDEILSYLKSRNLQHYIDELPFYMDEMNQYWYYATTGNGRWSRMKPVGQNNPKKRPRLTLHRWPSR